MNAFNHLSRKEFFYLMLSLSVPTIVMGASAYQVYFNNKPQTIEFEVFENNVYYYPELRMNQTQILTWGTGKYYFIGTWNNFEEDHSYQVTYVRKASGRPFSHLIIIDWEEIQ